jgi:tetratricopeptide (TPR) repeat protein
MNLYKDAEKLIEDFFQNFEMHIAPKNGCDEVAVQRVKETLALYLEFTGDDGEKLDRSELESIFRAALTDFLYEVYFTLEDAGIPAEAQGDDEDLDEDEDWEDDEEDSEEYEDNEEDEEDEEDEAAFYEILSLGELCDMLREDPDAHAECDCLIDKALCAAQETPREVVERLEALVEDLRRRPATSAIRKILAEGYLALGEVHVGAGEHARGIAAFKQAARVHGVLPEAWARVAQTHLDLGDLPSAIEAWREQIRLAPDDPEPYFSAARALETLEKPERAMEMLEAMLAIDGDNAAALDALVRLARACGNEEAVRRYRERILALAPPRRIEDIAVWVKHHIEERHFDAVLEHLHKEELDTPEQSTLNLLKALVFLAKDDPDNVEVELLLFRDKQNGRADEVREALGELERIFGEPRIDPLRRAISEHVTR